MPDELILEQEHDIPAPARHAETGRDLALWSAAIINFNGGVLVGETIASIKAMDHPPEEILLVDDGSTDDSLATVRIRFPDVRILPMPRHTGRPAAVRNAALRNARHRYVLLCDNDVQLAPDAVLHLMATMRSFPDVAVCSGVVVADAKTGLVETRARALHFLCWSIALRERSLAEARAVGPQLGMGCGIQLLDREMAAAAGWFDENLAHGWMDDGDLHYRLILFGHPCLSVPAAVVVHGRGRKVSRTYGQIHNRWYIMLSHYQIRTLVAIAPAMILFELLLVCQMALTGEIRSYARALRDVASKLPQIREQRRKVQHGRAVADKDVLCALDLDLPRHLRDRKGLVLLMRSVSLLFRWYWSVVRRAL